VKLAGHDVSATFSAPAAAVRWREEVRDALRAGRPTPGPPDKPVKVEPVTVFDMYMAAGRAMTSGRLLTRKRTRYKPSVIRRTESLLRVHVVSRIGRVPVAAVGRRDVQRLVDDIEADKGPETARKALHALAVVMRHAEREGLVERSPVERIATTAQTDEHAVRVLTRDELADVLDAARADDERLSRSLAVPLVTLAVSTGLRLGELLALRWAPHEADDGLDIDAGLVRVRWSVDRARDKTTGRFPLVPPKTPSSVRDVPLGAGDLATIRRHLLAVGRPDPGTFVFADRNGQVLAPTGSPRHTWRRVATAAGIDPIPRFHDLRHTWAVHMLRSGVRPEAVARLGGWSGTAIVHNRYGRHALPDELATAGERLEHWRADTAGTT
ncbi:MAG: tyrosine-type recombinase/integrase, partial [Thermoleophilia bacterium]